MGLLIDAAWYFLQGMIGLRLSETSLRGPPGRRRAVFFLRGMICFRLSEASLRGPLESKLLGRRFSTRRERWKIEKAKRQVRLAPV